MQWGFPPYKVHILIYLMNIHCSNETVNPTEYLGFDKLQEWSCCDLSMSLEPSKLKIEPYREPHLICFYLFIYIFIRALSIWDDKKASEILKFNKVYMAKNYDLILLRIMILVASYRRFFEY